MDLYVLCVLRYLFGQLQPIDAVRNADLGFNLSRVTGGVRPPCKISSVADISQQSGLGVSLSINTLALFRASGLVDQRSLGNLHGEVRL